MASTWVTELNKKLNIGIPWIDTLNEQYPLIYCKFDTDSSYSLEIDNCSLR